VKAIRLILVHVMRAEEDEEALLLRDEERKNGKATAVSIREGVQRRALA